MKNSTFAQRLRAGLDARQMTQAELSSRSKISKSSISHYLKGDWEGKQDAVYSLAQVLDVSEAWLMGYDVPMDSEHSQPATTSPAPIPPGFMPMPKMKKVPLIGAIACGDPITALQNREGNVDVPEDVRCDFALKCHGDSMVGAGIHDGDVVYIHIQPDVENGEIAAVRIGDEATLKRVYLHTDYIELRPENPAFESIIRRKEDMNDVHIEGKAVGYTHWF
jgi:repressor LexA